jgi:hypothetical protein
MNMSDEEDELAYEYDDDDEDESEVEVEGDECSALDLDVPQSACGMSDVVRLSQLKSTIDDSMFFGVTLLRRAQATLRLGRTQNYHRRKSKTRSLTFNVGATVPKPIDAQFRKRDEVFFGFNAGQVDA